MALRCSLYRRQICYSGESMLTIIFLCSLLWLIKFDCCRCKQINMMMLGSTLTQGVKSIPEDFRWAPNLAVAFGKLIIVPTIATVVVCMFHSFVPIQTDTAASLYFAMLIVTCTPTANNINVMAEIGGVNKDTMALCILTQYLFAPVTITFWVTVFQFLVRDW